MTPPPSPTAYLTKGLSEDEAWTVYARFLLCSGHRILRGNYKWDAEREEFTYRGKTVKQLVQRPNTWEYNLEAKDIPAQYATCHKCKNSTYWSDLESCICTHVRRDGTVCGGMYADHQVPWWIQDEKRHPPPGNHDDSSTKHETYEPDEKQQEAIDKVVLQELRVHHPQNPHVQILEAKIEATQAKTAPAKTKVDDKRKLEELKQKKEDSCRV